MRAAAPIVAIIVMVASSPANAFDATQVDIIGLHLGMADSDVTSTLRRQGYAVTHDHGALAARTRDGQLTVDLTDQRTVRQIRYTFTGLGVREPEEIQAAILDRFGPPDQAQPMTWCQKLMQGGLCPDNAPTMMFLPQTLTMTLRTGDASKP